MPAADRGGDGPVKVQEYGDFSHALSTACIVADCGQASQKRRPCVFLEQIDPPHVAPERVQALVPADLAELPDRGAQLGGTGQKAGAGLWPL